MEETAFGGGGGGWEYVKQSGTAHKGCYVRLGTGLKALRFKQTTMFRNGKKNPGTWYDFLAQSKEPGLDKQELEDVEFIQLTQNTIYLGLL
jgi:hypothetical protein